MVDVTVLTKDNIRTIDRCLSAIREAMPEAKLLCIDNGSTDGTVEIVKGYADEFHSRPELSVGQMRYLQAKLCSTDWIAYVDSDAYLYPEWFSTISKYLERGSPYVMGRMKFLSSLPVYEEWWSHQMDLYGMYGIADTMVRRRLMLEMKRVIDLPEARIADYRMMGYMRKTRQHPILTKETISFHDSDMAVKHPWQNFKVGRDWGKEQMPVPLFHFAVNMADTLVKFSSFCLYRRRFDTRLLRYLMMSYMTPFVRGMMN